jgi:hypothetical protein
MMSTVKHMMRAALPFALVLVAACEDTSGPNSFELNTEAALADYRAMDAVLQTTGWKSFQMAAMKMDDAAVGASTAGAVRATAALQSLAGGDTREFATIMANVAANGSASVPLVSEANRGKTFIYNAQTHSWQIDPARTGAPATGVRFITYEPKGAEPDPTKPIGHADLIDLGDNTSGVALRLVVVQGNLTIVDYHTTLAGENGSGRITVDGYVQNTIDKLEFEIDVRGQNVNGVERGDVAIELAIAEREFRVVGDVRSEKENGLEESTVDLTVRHGAASFRVDVENDRGALSGRIDLNDAPFATVSGRDGAPVFKNPQGGDITGGEALVLWRVFDVPEDVFDLFEDLIEPIAALVIFAIIL